MADVIARLTAALQPRVRGTSPVVARRKDSDTRAPGGTGERYPHAGTLDSRKRGGTHPATYRPTVAEIAANPVPATARLPFEGSVKPAGGIKLTGNMTVEDARATGESTARRAWVTARANIEREAGDVLGAGERYPRRLTEMGNLGPSPVYPDRYGNVPR